MTILSGKTRACEAFDGGVTALKVFTPKDPTAPTVVAVLLIGIVMVVMFWGEIAAGGVSAAVVVGTWVVLAAMAWRASRTMADRKIVVNGNTLELVKGSSSKTVNLSEVESLQQARVKSGRTSYVAFLAFLESGERVELFADGQFADQDGLKSAIADAAGKTWRGYAQSLTYDGNPLVSSGDYATDQLPFPAFEAIASDPTYAKTHIVPLQQMAIDLQSAETAPNFAWFAANEDFNGEGPIDFPIGMLNFVLGQLSPAHQYNVQALDQFLSETVPVIMNSPVWNDPTLKTAVVVTFDEDNNNLSLGIGNEGNHIVTVVIPSPGAIAGGMRPGSYTATNHYNHYSLLRMIEDSLGLPYLTTNDQYASPMNEFWTAGVV